jgi:GTPase
MFVDEIKVVARAGHGGKGCVAFQREKYRPKGGPSGGNGGRGGNVVLQADHDLNNLIAQYFNPRLVAEDGEAGMGKGMDGHAGADLVVKVPCGTLVWRLPDTDPAGELPETGEMAHLSLPAGSRRRAVLRYAGRERALEMTGDESEPPPPCPAWTRPDQQGELVTDLTRHDQTFVLCQGGRGGLGNRNFATAVRQTPRFAQPGEPGEEGQFLLELRLLADVGLVGYPNAGKSTLLTAISKARPKVAPYPFTTLHPQVGIVEYPDFHRLVVCDVPGLIEGAHRNVGLGHAFLRHIERCKVLVLLLDMAGSDGRAPWEDHEQLLRELALYDAALPRKPRLVAANKMDEPAAAQNLRKFKRRVPRTPVLTLAAAFDQGIECFKDTIREAVAQAGAAPA